MKHLSIALVIFLFLALPVISFGQNLSQILTYEKTLDSLQKINISPGGVLGVYKNENTWVGSFGFQDLKREITFQNTTQFRCGSITKVFIAVIALQLVEEGKLSLTAPITNYIPILSHQIPNANQITIRNLLEHSSGLGHPTEDLLKYRLRLALFPISMGKLDYRKRLEKYVYNHELKNTPGKEIYYSNAGYWVLSLILEHCSQQSIEDLIINRICIPLRLSSTYLSRKNDDSISKGYNYLWGGKLRTVSKWDRADNDGDPAAGLVSNVPDLLLFSESLFGGKLISDSSLNEMIYTNQFPPCKPACGYGLGIETWQISQYSGYGKNGSSIGVDANFIYFPEQKTSIVLFFNYGGGNKKDLINSILQNP